MHSTKLVIICTLVAAVVASITTFSIMLATGYEQAHVDYEDPSEITVPEPPAPEPEPTPEPTVPKTIHVKGDELYINGELTDVDIMHHVPSNHTIAPIYQLADYMDLIYYWGDHTLDIDGYGVYMYMIVGETEVRIDGTPQEMPVPLILHEKRSMIPLRFMAETMGYTVTWESGPIEVYRDVPTPDTTDVILEQVLLTNSRLDEDTALLIAESINRYSRKYNVDPLLVTAMMHTESHYRPGVTGRAGEVSLMQIMPSTGQYIADTIGMSSYNLWDIETNVKFGAWYLQHNLSLVQEMDYHHDIPFTEIELAVIAYNTGIHNLQRHITNNTIPTRYLNTVRSNSITE